MKSFFTNHGMQRNGFTLIELLIVITIVALLSVAGLSSFDSARQHASLSIAGDKLVSVLKQQQLLAKTGKIKNVTGVAGQPGFQQVLCYGVRLNADGVDLVQAPYVGFDGAAGSVQVARPVDYCDLSGLTKQPFNAGSSFQIGSIKYADSAVSGETMVFFRPPFGAPQIFEDGNVLSKPTDQNPVLDFTVTTSSANNSPYFVRFNLGTGLIEHLLPS